MDLLTTMIHYASAKINLFVLTIRKLSFAFYIGKSVVLCYRKKLTKMAGGGQACQTACRKGNLQIEASAWAVNIYYFTRKI